MKFVDRVKELKRLVKERKEIPLEDLVSILYVSPNYARDLKKAALAGGDVVEDGIHFYNPAKPTFHTIFPMREKASRAELHIKSSCNLGVAS